MTTSTLPDTLSKLITAAVRNARSLNRSLYIPFAREWHVPENGRCLVCLAGTMMAGSLNARPQREYSPSDFAHIDMDKLFALNKLREGNWIAAWNLFYGGRPGPSTTAQLSALAAHSFPMFGGWTQFDEHLRSLERTVPRLRKIEEQAGLH